MSSIQFHRRYGADGRCKVICMQCFQTLGTAWDRQSVEEMEAAHLCEYWRQGAPAAPGRARAGKLTGAPAFVGQILQMPAGWLMLLTLLLVYGVPTAVELGARGALNPWLAVILPGDAIGCAVLGGLLRRPRSAVFLYLLLTALEGASYAGGWLHGRELVWFADLVPALIVLFLLLRMKMGERALAAS